ncbi:hypothetical protein Rleg4DRAFT_3231 [Rhizobium leguminosarum bv. trifolii WSM2297]|uniref:Uncharacterized protein n=1 Tax=Rhizobium leguminosarum bv. trifolii WSM2297 TaxID=754762 RepID=J0W6Z2_RHILT|nr:hypothetical protein [Rhizobium leguminosarum]EJC81546.1 hypothetical protein Rleg4DRAFT_3231 [Rhizobium leguminosarum bv. trifolii WSM2297]
MTPEERTILKALAHMCLQYMDDGAEGLVHKSMSAGESAVEVLASYGLVKPEPGGGFWTDEGLRLLDDEWASDRASFLQRMSKP